MYYNDSLSKVTVTKLSHRISNYSENHHLHKVIDEQKWSENQQCVLSRNLRIFKVARWHYRCRHKLKNNCIWDNLQCCLFLCQGHLVSLWCWPLTCNLEKCYSLRSFFRDVTIRVPHDTIRISIQRSRYDTYLDTYLSTVGGQREAVRSMKTETPVIRSTAHNLLLQWMEYLLWQLPLVGRKHDFAQLFQVYIRLFLSTWSEKICVLIDPFQE